MPDLRGGPSTGVEEAEFPPGYPRQWEADVVLIDGGVARLRPIRPDDADMLVAFYDRISPESKYLRFFAPYPRLSSRDVYRFTHVDYVDRVALILTIGEDMIAVGRYDRLDDEANTYATAARFRAKAEVAFLVEDAHQGRGIAQLLLEHLAQAARERGINGFVAEVLPENRRMAQVFADAGYRVSKGIEDGVLMVEFPILPTDTSVGVMERREHRAEATSIRRLLTPHRVAMVGPGRRLGHLVDSMITGGFRGHLTAVPTDDQPVPGVPNAPSIAAIDDGVDLAVVSLPTRELGAVVIDAAHRGAHGIVVLTGTDCGAGDNRTVVNLARAYGIRALGPDALGLVNVDPDVGLNASPGPMPRHGSVGLFCQSAAIGLALLKTAIRHHVGLSNFISTGDFADVTGNDVMQFWEDDDATRVCLLSLDSIGNPRKFSRIVRRLTRRKPVVVFAPGRANRASHLGDRGGLDRAPDAAVDALFRQAGVMVVHQRGAMFDIAKIVARQPLPTGPRVRLITNSRPLSAQLSHTVRAVGLLGSEDTREVGCDGDAADFAAAARAAMADPTCDSVVCAVVNAFEGESGAVREELNAIAATSTKPIVGVFLDFASTDEPAAGADVFGTLPVFDGPVGPINALSAITAYAHWRERDPGAVPMMDVDEQAARRLVNRCLADQPQGRALTDAETAELLAAYGITVVPRYPVQSLEEAVAVAERLGWNVILKAGAPAVRGRPDQASVYRNIDDADELRHAWEALGLLVEGLGLGVASDQTVSTPVIQAMSPPGVALVVSSREDAAFGPMVSLGLDGIASELLGDLVHRVPPLTTVDAALMVRDLRAAPTLFGRHGSSGVDVEAVQDLVHRVALLADDVPQLASLTLSPCVAAISGISVLGARAQIAPTHDQRDPLARIM